MTSAAIVLSTFPTDQEPATLARTLVEERLAACVNVLPAMQSIYRWEGRIEHASEHQLVIKTSTERVAALTRRLAELHPYEVPEILVLSVEGGGDAYLAWVAASTGTDSA
jgi:periplasmic divalent cation tolerance protein